MALMTMEIPMATTMIKQINCPKDSGSSSVNT
jgi:hypothetical protein